MLVDWLVLREERDIASIQGAFGRHAYHCSWAALEVTHKLKKPGPKSGPPRTGVALGARPCVTFATIP